MRSRFLTPLLLLAACQSIPVPAPSGRDTSIVAIQVRTRAHGRTETTYPDQAWFVRLDEPGDPAHAAPVLVSSYHRAGHVYLLDAAPGWYYAVACAELIDGKTHYTYFPADTITATGVEVGPGAFAYAGLVQISKSAGLGRADEVQLHFAGLVNPQPPNPPPLVALFPRTRTFTGRDASVDRGPDRRANAHERARGFLARHGWTDRLD